MLSRETVASKKRVCKPWLDGIFHALYEDLKAYYAWLSEEERFAAIEEDDEAELPEDDSADPANVSVEEWLHRASIAQRLQNLSDAERALRNAAAHNSPRAWERLMTMYASEGCIKETLVAVHELLECYESFRAPHPPPAPQQAVHAIASLVGAHGLQKVRDAQDAIAPPHPTVNDLFHLAVRARWHGFAN
mmetsp:Transcript_32786/g.74757  ORF Transcript_32786/g.74757 Transcript_32786/m.74757 type:complete len:191 (-) Transcript_32786:40-612(-)